VASDGFQWIVQISRMSLMSAATGLDSMLLGFSLESAEDFEVVFDRVDQVLCGVEQVLQRRDVGVGIAEFIDPAANDTDGFGYVGNELRNRRCTTEDLHRDTFD
jgi:hypothetical protein